MAPYIRVVDGQVDTIGPLPATARRLDTLHRVDPRTRMKACGYYDVETVTADQLPPNLSSTQRKAVLAEAAAATERHEDKTGFVDTGLRPDLETGRDYDWAWLQKYSAVQFPGLEPGAGAGWTSTPPAARQDILRTALSWVMYQQVQLAHFADLSGQLLRPLFDVTDLVRPPIPTPPTPTVLPAEAEEPS